MNEVKQTTRLEQLTSHPGVRQNMTVPELIETILSRGEGSLTSTGAIRATTGKYTGRSPKDKFIVMDDESRQLVDWGTINQSINEDVFLSLYEKVLHYLTNKNELYLFKGYAGSDKTYRLPIQVINEYAWHNLFARQLFVRPKENELKTHESEFTIVSAPSFKAVPELDGTNSEAFILVSFKHKVVLIGGTEYAGEMKKSIFSVMNYLLPQQQVLPMHCSANKGESDDVTLFFGLSGTGKTTLSADPSRKLIGDDEHAWGPNGVFNIEGGCYAKCINLSKEKEPQIYHAIRYGSVLENVSINKLTRNPDYNDTSLTENTRAAYPITNMDNITTDPVAQHPNTIIFLTADAFGVLPPISKLTKEQAMYHFLSGYTSKLAGTERGVTEPEATFSSCFGAPFLPLTPETYAEMLGEKMDRYGTNVFLVNTGWTGGSYGEGQRMDLTYTRAMVQAAISGELDTVKTSVDAIFGLHIPTSCPGVPDELLVPKQTWAQKADYEIKAKELATRFHQNFERFSQTSETIKKAGPLFGSN
ncbi:phosphoenolpyruvate carboxykinase (ATP) [Aquibacillus sp. 3ASR75-11]|uniref:Phosphoenolpyruvate carboxykinase (ATP) n=1 Tax=Terrihalobacillus insolitus TaxID=2950438 RepID=A0A9X3WT08_9BACI|nr:phosphoenolpyruvate carboxykinase (ATP) [Terrihalobacillus insolitus]MDC3412413.1 phosphoenolpyruvate carboxykinase (ATP) [Terrihalobacillus insolitus]MDC3422894.1 phosphoenolpyruvate carboxykinase (ATP) [Terrihalobacillus insolitus]